MGTESLKNKVQTQQTTPTKAQQQPNTIFALLEQHKKQIALALPKHMTAERMVRIVTTEVRKVPDLLKCNPVSLFGAVIQCSQLGLEPGNNLGHAYLLPFRNTKQNTTDVQLIIGYRGMLVLARNSGQIVSIQVFEVFSKDKFHISLGMNPSIQHEIVDYADRGEFIGVYAVAHLKDGGVQFEFMTKAQVDEIRKSSKAGNSQYSPWATHYNEMAKKTVIRRLFKYLPVSIEIQQAVTLDEAADAGIGQNNNALLYPDAIDIEQSNVVDGVDQETGEVMDDELQVDPAIQAAAQAKFNI
ncbi:MAG: recombination protein RecT [Neisseriaceae bacterium]|nr:MAG: recombination protein RecT [Neisseriaceae bacterium]